MALDIALDSNLDLGVSNRMIRGRDATAQRVRIRLQQHLGDWVLNTSKGVDWATYLSTKPVPLANIEAAVYREISTTPGVLAVGDVVGSVVDRALTITATYTTAEGEQAATLSAAPGARNFALAAHVAPSGAIGR